MEGGEERKSAIKVPRRFKKWSVSPSLVVGGKWHFAIMPINKMPDVTDPEQIELDRVKQGNCCDARDHHGKAWQRMATRK